MLINWTTPTIQCTIPSDIVFDYILMTLLQKETNIKIEKTIMAESVDEGKFSVYFTQEETGQLSTDYLVEVQCNIMNGLTRLATKKVKMQVGDNLHDAVIEE